MLLSILRQDMPLAQKVLIFGAIIITSLISLTVHEYSHGYVAYRSGDNTARNLGRLTLNPLSHLDIIGTLMMLVFGFGYAKTVPINPRNFNHYKRDLAFVSLAGPVSNLLLALLMDILFRITAVALPEAMQSSTMFTVWLIFCYYFVILNVGLAVFNLLPLPPLDGSRVVSVLLPSKIAYYYLKYEQIIMIVVFALLYLGGLDGILGFLRSGVIRGMTWLLDLTPLKPGVGSIFFW